MVAEKRLPCALISLHHSLNAPVRGAELWLPAAALAVMAHSRGAQVVERQTPGR